MIATAATLAALALTAVAADVEEGIESRIKSVDSVCMSGDECAAAPVAAAPAEPRTGAEVYDTKCTTCHGLGVAGAPKMGEASQWGPRAAQGMDTLFDHAWNGFNGMPAKGLCMDCSEDEIRGAIQHMLDNSQ
nr:cytochrome c5 family protein [Marinibactrum halimedae]